MASLPAATRRTVRSWENSGFGVSVAIASRIESKKEMKTLVPVGKLALHSGIESMLTSALLFGITTIVRFVIAPSPISGCCREFTRSC